MEKENNNNQVNNAQLKKSMKAILATEQIKAVIYVDDNLSGDTTFIRSSIYSNLKKMRQDDAVRNLIKVDFEIPDEDILASQIEEAYQQANKEDKAKINEMIFGDIDNDQSIYNELLTIFDKELIVAITPDKCEEVIEEYYSKENLGGKLLILLDQDFKHATERFRITTGIQLLSKLLKRDEKRLMIFGMITHLIKDISKEMEWRNTQLANLADVEASTFFALTKKRSNDSQLLADGIRKILLNPYFEEIKKVSYKILAHATDTMRKEIQKIDTYTFDEMVIKSSVSEGVWEGETYFRIADILLKHDIKNNMKSDAFLENINLLFEKAYTLSSKKIGVDYAKAYSYVHKKNLRTKEIYEDGDIINGLHEPVMNGDIFEVLIKEDTGEKKEKYILLDQECDLMLRSNGKRQSKIGRLIKIKEISHSDLAAEINVFAEKNKHKNHYLALRGVMEYFSGENILGLVEFKHTLLVYMDCIDLVSINKTGEAKYDINNVYPVNCFRKSLKNRFSKLTSHWKEKNDEYNEIESQFKILKEDIANSIMEKFLINLSPTEKNAGSPKPFRSGLFDFGITRIMRYKHPFSEILLSRYSNFLSRVAEKHDFAEMN